MSEIPVTTEQVRELIQQLAAQTVAASITPEMVANIFENMRQLNDQEKDKLIAITQAYLRELNQAGIVGFISKETTQSEEDDVVYETNNGTVVGTVGPNGANFINLKRGGQQVARMSDLPTKDTSIGDTPSASHVPTTKAVKDYVDANRGGGYPIEKESTQSEDEEQVWGDEAGTQEYVKIGPYGMKSKAYLDMYGNPIGGGGGSYLSGKKIKIFGGSVSALFDSYGGTNIVEQALNVTIYDVGVHGSGFITNIAVNNNAIEYSGVNIQKTVEEHTQANSEVCDVYIFWASTNDYYRIMNDTSLIGSPEDYTAKDQFNINKRLNQCGGLNYCVRRIQNFNPAAKIVIFGSLKAFKGEDTHYIEDRDSLSGKFKQMVDGQELCAKRMSLPFYSLWENSGINEYNCEYYMYHDENDTFYGSPAHGNDGIHPNAIAYEMIAKKIIQFLKTI